MLDVEAKYFVSFFPETGISFPLEKSGRKCPSPTQNKK